MHQQSVRTIYPRVDAAIIQHIRSAAFLNPRMIARQWGIEQFHAQQLYDIHYRTSCSSVPRVPLSPAYLTSRITNCHSLKGNQ